MDAHSLYSVSVTIETAGGTRDYQKTDRTAAQALQDVDHYRFIAPKGSTLHIRITEVEI